MIWLRGFSDGRVTEREVDGINCHHAADRTDGIGDGDGEVALAATYFEEIRPPGYLPGFDKTLAVCDRW